MKKPLVIVLSLAAVAGAAWFFTRGAGDAPEIEYRYAPIEAGELVSSISATGQVVALTTVDVKSKAGGKIVKLAVEEGSAVKQGDLIAVIDPADTQAIYEQAEADVRSAAARADQARTNARLTELSTGTSVADAEIALETAKIRLARTEEQATAQPKLSSAELQTAQAQLLAQEEALRMLERVTIPQQQRDAEGAASRTRAELSAAEAEAKRQEELWRKGYVSKGSYDRAIASLESARAASTTAEQRLKTLAADHASQLATQRARVDQARAALRQAQANQNRVTITQKDLEEARRQVRAAEISLQRAKNERLNVRARESEIRTAEASAVRSRVSMANAKVQLDSTTVLAPRDGVVTLKYLEEGTIIPPGTSTFAQGTSIVQISDTTRMFVECAVDEADIAQVRPGQKVRIIVEAFPGRRVEGVVRRVNPAAQTVQNITSIKVRVEVVPGAKVALLPGMNATCEFLTMVKPKVLIAPSQAVKREGQKTVVKLKTADPKKPATREVKVGETGNDGVEILEGLKEGDQVVVAEIDLKQLRETQQRMQEAMQGGGLAAGPTGGGRGGMGGTRTGGGGGTRGR